MSLPECTVNTNNIQNLPDSPSLAPNELKQEFDKSSKDLKDYLNEVLLPAVEKLVRDEKANLETEMNNKILADNKKKYHIGKIIMSTSDVNPNKYLGFGTWILWGSGRVPVGVDTNNTNFNTVEKTGGEEKHTLTIPEMPKHIHNQHVANGQGNFEWGYQFNYGGHNSAVNNGAIEYTGENQSHNNLQPYIVCYMWKRTA